MDVQPYDKQSTARAVVLVVVYLVSTTVGSGLLTLFVYVVQGVANPDAAASASRFGGMDSLDAVAVPMLLPLLALVHWVFYALCLAGVGKGWDLRVLAVIPCWSLVIVPILVWLAADMVFNPTQMFNYTGARFLPSWSVISFPVTLICAGLWLLVGWVVIAGLLRRRADASRTTDEQTPRVLPEDVRTVLSIALLVGFVVVSSWTIGLTHALLETGDRPTNIPFAWLLITAELLAFVLGTHRMVIGSSGPGFWIAGGVLLASLPSVIVGLVGGVLLVFAPRAIDRDLEGWVSPWSIVAGVVALAYAVMWVLAMRTALKETAARYRRSKANRPAPFYGPAPPFYGPSTQPHEAVTPVAAQPLPAPMAPQAMRAKPAKNGVTLTIGWKGPVIGLVAVAALVAGLLVTTAVLRSQQQSEFKARCKAENGTLEIFRHSDAQFCHHRTEKSRTSPDRPAIIGSLYSRRDLPFGGWYWTYDLYWRSSL